MVKAVPAESKEVALRTVGAVRNFTKELNITEIELSADGEIPIQALLKAASAERKKENPAKRACETRRTTARWNDCAPVAAARSYLPLPRGGGLRHAADGFPIAGAAARLD